MFAGLENVLLAYVSSRSSLNPPVVSSLLIVHRMGFFSWSILLFMFRVCHADLSVHCSLMITMWYIVPGAVPVLDCIDYGSLPSSLLWFWTVISYEAVWFGTVKLENAFSGSSVGLDCIVWIWCLNHMLIRECFACACFSWLCSPFLAFKW